MKIIAREKLILSLATRCCRDEKPLQYFIIASHKFHHNITVESTKLLKFIFAVNKVNGVSNAIITRVPAKQP